ncbi:MAG: hypothetical protein Q8J84_09215 [Flavobacteriaceae bacterium]|nr:hypothetical protein [Flavobacteriaceae bacterium]
MKKLTVSILTVFLSLTFVPTQMNAATPTNPVTTVSTETTVATESNALVIRLDEIKAMDKSTLNSAEKKELRKEVRAIKSELRETGGGIYLSALAVLIIVLLIVLL